MPKVYNTYKMNKIYANISELQTELSENEHIDLYKLGKEKMNFNDQRAFGNDDNIVKEVYIKSLDKYCMIRVHVYVKPVDEATTIVSLFFPFAILVSLVMALLISTYYSRVVSKPLIKINEAAKKMAKLDFDNYIEVDGQDEIAELSLHKT